MFIKFEQEAISNAVETIDSLDPPAGATGAELQADTGNIRYTMDGTAPTTSSGMLLLATHPPKEFTIEALRAIKMIRDGAGDANLNVHYFGRAE